MPNSEIYCVPVRFANGEVVYVPVEEYRTNPPAGSFELRSRMKADYPEPVYAEIPTSRWRQR